MNARSLGEGAQLQHDENDESAQYWKSILENVRDGFWVLDCDWCCTYINSRQAELIGMPKEDVVGKNVWNLFPDLVGTEIYRKLHQAFAEQTPVHFEHFNPTWQGWFEIRVYPCAKQVSLLTIDITDRKQAQEARQDKQHLVQQLAEMSPGLLYLYDIFEQRNIYVNARSLDLLGYPPETVLAMGTDFMAQVMHPDELAQMPAHFERLNTAQESKFLDIEYRMRHANGEWRWFSGRETVFSRTSLGQIRQILGMAQDITERKQAQEALRNSEERFHAFMNYSPASAWMADQEGHIRYLSPTYFRMFQFQEQDAVGKHILDIYPAEFAQQFLDNNKRVFETKQVFEAVETAPRPDGSIGEFLVFKFPIIRTSGEMLLGGVAVDITERKRAEEALRRREEELRLIANAVPALIAYIDTQQCYRFNNRSYEEWFGSSAAELFGKHIRDVLGETTYARIRPYVEQALSGQSVTFESQVLYKNSETRYISATYIPRFNNQGGVEGFVSLVSDISDRKQKEVERQQLLEQVRIERELLQAVLQQMPAGVIVAEGSSGNIILANDQIKQIWRIPKLLPIDNLARREGYQGFRSDGRPYQPHEWPLARSVKTGEVVTEEEINIVRGDGTSGTILVNSAPVYDTQGNIRAGVIAFYDITERKRAEAEIATLNRDLENRVNELQTLFEVIPIGILIAEDPDFKHVRANPAFAQILGIATDGNASYTPPVGNPHPSYKIFHNGKELTPNETPLRYAGIHGTEVERAEVDILRHDGALFNLYGYAAPLFDEQGKVRGSVGAFLDITERKRAEAEREQLLERERVTREAAEAANRIKDEFLAMLSHELRSPLNPILGWTKLLRTRQFDQVTIDRALETIERNAQLQTQLIEDLLDVSRILRGKMVLNSCSVNLVSVIEAALETVQLALQAKGIEIQTVLVPNVGEVFGDSGRLQQVVWNLLSNAVKFTPSGGRVELRLESVGSHAQIQIKDTGKGIQREFLPHVFEYFRQEDGKTTRQFGGLGLGLAIVRHLVELHGGTVQADSPGEGQGATFTVKLPLNAIAEQASQTREPLIATLNLNPLRILVVDDEVDMQELMLTILEEYGAEVKVTVSATEALTTLAEFKPDVLISDIGMPDIDGYMLIKQVRQLPPKQGGLIPAIALTAYAGELNQQQAIEAGFQRHIAKPTEPYELVKAIVALVGKSHNGSTEVS